MSNNGTVQIQAKKQGKNGTYLDLYPKSKYDPTAYERPVLTVDIAVFRHIPKSGIGNGFRDQILLIKRGQAPFKNRWAFPGGYVNVRDLESIDEAVLRELHEETGVTNLLCTPEQFRTYASAERDPRWYTVDTVYQYHMSGMEADLVKPKAGDDAAEVKWFNVTDAMKLKLAFDHNVILEDLLARP